MKTILKIAVHELKLLFCSPIAWLMLIIFLYQFGSSFAGSLSGLKADVLRYYPGYTAWLFSSGMFPNVERSIYLYIPLMTMGLMSQDLSTGNIKLLFSSPIKTSSIVLGKYFGIMAYWLIVIFLFSLFAIPPYFMIMNLDMGIVLPGILAIFLLACTYSAIGLFMSCLTTYQVVAALSTLTVLSALNYLGGLWQGVPVLKDIINFLHIAGHAENMNTGFIKSKDVLYFIIVTVLFLGLAIFYLQDVIQSRSRSEKLKRYFIFTAVMLLLGCISSLRTMTLYFDATATKFNTISRSSQETLRKIKGPVSITAYSNLFGADNSVGMPEYRIKDFNFWEPYIRFLPQLELKYVNYYDRDPHDPSYTTASKLDSVASQQATRVGWYIEDFLTPAEIHKIIDLKPEGLSFVRTVEQGNKRRFLRVFNDFAHVPTEQEIMTTLNGLLIDYPKIGFLTGHYERAIDNNEDRAYKLVANEGPNRGSLINKGFTVRNIPVTGAIPSDIDALVIGEPLTPFNAEEIEKIRNYIAFGGNLLLTAGPKSQDILNPMIAPIGVQFMKGQLIANNEQFSEDMVFTHTPLREGGDNYEFQFSIPLAMPASIGVQYQAKEGFKIEEAIVTDESTTWNKTENGDTHQQIPVAVSMTRMRGKKQQRIMVVGNGSFMSNAILSSDFGQIPPANAAFANELFKWFSYGKYPITVAPLAHPKDAEVNYTKVDFDKFKLYYTWLLPVLVFLFGAVFLFRRKRK